MTIWLEWCYKCREVIGTFHAHLHLVDADEDPARIQARTTQVEAILLRKISMFEGRRKENVTLDVELRFSRYSLYLQLAR